MLSHATKPGQLWLPITYTHGDSLQNYLGVLETPNRSFPFFSPWKKRTQTAPLSTHSLTLLSRLGTARKRHTGSDFHQLAFKKLPSPLSIKCRTASSIRN